MIFFSFILLEFHTTHGNVIFKGSIFACDTLSLNHNNVTEPSVYYPYLLLFLFINMSDLFSFGYSYPSLKNTKIENFFSKKKIYIQFHKNKKTQNLIFHRFILFISLHSLFASKRAIGNTKTEIESPYHFSLHFTSFYPLHKTRFFVLQNWKKKIR